MQPWIPVPKTLLHKILRTAPRPFLEEIAYLSAALDCDEGRAVTVAGYAGLWGWGRGKVSRFLKKIGAAIQYPEDTTHRQNQRGYIVLRPENGRTDREQMLGRLQTDSEQIRLISFNGLGLTADRSRPHSEQMSYRSPSTTKDTNTKTKKNTSSNPSPKQQNTVASFASECFEESWQAYPCRDGSKKKIQQKILKEVKTEGDTADLKLALKNYLQHVDLQRNNGFADLRYKNRTTWFNNWRDWVEWEPPKETTATPAELTPEQQEREDRWNNLTLPKA
jgi:hypothetical protein